MGKKNEATRDEYVLKNNRNDPSYRKVYGNYPAQKYKKGTPSQIRLSFEFTGGSTQFIDIARALSIVNRKMHRQGCYYYVNSVELYNNEDAFVDLHVLPDTWMTRSAYRRALGIFNEQTERGLAQAGNVAGKYHDFKVYMSPTHRTTGSANPSLHDINSAAQAYSPDDWNYSQFVSADDDQDGVANADEFYGHMLGDHVGTSDNWTTIGLIKSYHETRPRVSTEPVLDGNILADPLLNLFDYSSEEQMNDVIENLNEHNDESPYNMDEMVGESDASMQQVGRLVTTTTLGRKDSISGFCAPLGLICVDPQETATAYRIVINLAPGTYHGVYAERMA